EGARRAAQCGCTFEWQRCCILSPGGALLRTERRNDPYGPSSRPQSPRFCSVQQCTARRFAPVRAAHLIARAEATRSTLLSVAHAAAVVESDPLVRRGSVSCGS